MKDKYIKIVEIRDRATFIPAMAVKMVPDGGIEEFLFKQIGYRHGNCILLLSLEAPWHSARSSDKWTTGARTMPVAHKWIEDNWNSIVNCQVIDVEFILKEVEKPCESVRKEQIDEALEGCDNEDDKMKIISMLWATGVIDSSEYLTKYAFWKCWICGEKRPDEFISVQVHDISLEQGGKNEGEIIVNVKYCNDKPACCGGAKIKECWIGRGVKKESDE